MSTEIRIPEVSATRDSTVFLKWLKGKGDEVREGQPVAEIESNKRGNRARDRGFGDFGRAPHQEQRRRNLHL